MVEGLTEYRCIPLIADRLGHVTIGVAQIHGSSGDWPSVITRKVLGPARALALKQPDKLLVVLDKEDRTACTPELVTQALRIISADFRMNGLGCPVSLIVSDRNFECLLFADFELVDTLTIFREPVSQHLGDTTDGKNLAGIIKRCLEPSRKYEKVIHGRGIAKRMRLGEPTVLDRSRVLRKLLKEL